MVNQLGHVLLYVLFPIAATIGGAIIATIRAPGTQLRSAIQHFAAGVVFAAVAGELLPDAMHGGAPVLVAIGFSLGVLVMFAMRHWGEHREQAASSRAAQGETTTGAAKSSFGLIAAVGVDATLDGLVIGIGFAVGVRQGVLIAVALTLEMLFLGLATAATLLSGGAARGRVIAVVSALALLIGVGATLGVTLLGGLGGRALSGVLAFGCATLLYLVTEELLIEAHTVQETPIITSVFFAGFLLLLVIEMLV